MFRVKLRLRKQSLQRKRLADTAFLRQIRLSYGDTAFLLSTLAFSCSYGYFNRANISAGSSDTPSLLCTNVQGWYAIPTVVLTQKVKKCSYDLLTKHGRICQICCNSCTRHAVSVDETDYFGRSQLRFVIVESNAERYNHSLRGRWKSQMNRVRIA